MQITPTLDAIADAEIPAFLRRRPTDPPPKPVAAPALDAFVMPVTSAPKGKPHVSRARRRNAKDRAYAFVFKLMQDREQRTIGQIMKLAPEGVEQNVVKSALRRLIKTEKQITSDGRWYQWRR